MMNGWTHKGRWLVNNLGYTRSSWTKVVNPINSIYFRINNLAIKYLKYISIRSQKGCAD